MGEDLETLSKEQSTRLAQYFDEAVTQVEITKPGEVRFRTFLNRAGAERLELMKAD